MAKTGALLVLMYHGIYENNEELLKIPKEDRPYAVSLENFEIQMNILAASDKKKISLDLINSNSDEIYGEDGIILTFDDGWESISEYAIPILIKLNIFATIFMTVDKINKSGFMSENQLKQIISQGMTIGSHTYSHRFLNDLDKDDITEELIKSKKILEEKLNINVNQLSLPGGRNNSMVIRLAEQVGYGLLCTSVPGLNIPSSSKLEIKRIPIRNKLSNNNFEKLIKFNKGFINKLERIYKLKMGFKKILGNNLYFKLYKLIKG